MASDYVVEVVQSSIWTLLTVAGPILGILMLISLAVGVFQTSLQLHDPTINTIPRLLVGLLSLIWLLPWMTSRLLEYAGDSFAGVMRGF